MASSTNYLTQQENNSFKLQRLRDKSERCLLKLLHKKFPKNPTKLNAELKKHHGILTGLLKRNILKQEQYNLLFPTSQQTDSEKFDTTLLFLLIRTFCGYTEPSTGWNDEPDVNDRSEIANAIRLKLQRNKIGHGKLSVPTAEYKRIYRSYYQPLLDLGCPKPELDNLMPSFLYDIQTPTETFVGRENELDILYQTLNAKNQTKLAAIISGIPGIGKNELARQYCHQNSHTYDHIVWINADSNIESTYVDIAKILQLHDKSSTNVIAKLLKDYFKDGKVLFIFDNCTDINILSDVLFQNHHNIITTQTKHWASCYEVVPLDVWSPENALSYLKKCNLNQDQHLFDELINELGNHPLGIQHAVSFIEETQITLEEHLGYLKKQPIDVFLQKVITESCIGSRYTTICFSIFSNYNKQIEERKT